MKLGRRNDEEVRTPRAPKGGRGGQGDGARKKGGHFVLIIGDDGAILVFLQGSTVVRRLFAPSPRPDHTASIVELMRANPGVPLSILADVIDQQYVRHNFPPVSSFSVNNLVKRRMERDFQAEDLKNSMRLGREKEGRKEWSYLLIALANTPLMQQWLELIVELPNELKGIYLSPVEAQQYIPVLKKNIGTPNLPWQLLLTHNKVSGFRQVVLRDGKLVFTRVTQAIDDGVAAVLAGNVEQEIISTMEYLRRLGFLENDTLEMIVIAAQEVKEVLDLARFRVGGFQVLSPLDVADMLGLQQAALSADRFGDVVMASWFGTNKKRVLRFNTAYGEKLAKLYGIRRFVKTGGTLIAVALLGLAAWNLKDSIVIGGEATSIEQQRVPQQSEVAKLQKSLDGLDKDVAFKSAVVAANDVYIKNAISPLGFAYEFRRHATDIFRVKSFSWDVSGATGGNAVPAAPGTTAPLQAKMEIDIYGNFDDIEALTNATDTFIDNLRAAMPGYTITAEPYNWIQGTSDSMEISFDRKAENTTAATGDRMITLNFTAKPPAGAAPTGSPGMGGPGMMGAPGMP